MSLTAENAESAKESARLNELSEAIIGLAIAMHRALGGGLLESAYEACLAYELESRGLKIERQKPLPVVYRDVRLDCEYRMDLLVEGGIVVEIKAVDQLASVHEAQLLSYLRLFGCKLGLLINFNHTRVKDGIRRMVHGLED